MSHSRHIVTLLTCAVMVLTDVAMGYRYYSEVDGWVAKQPVIATWDEAVQQCRVEGAVLMSPIHRGHLNVMLSLMDGNTSYHTGTRTMTHPRLFMSLEGVSLVDMVITDMLDALSPQVGQCLSMTHNIFYSVPCMTQLPYLCYKKRTDNMDITGCGTTDKEYHLINATGSCYKYHRTVVTWMEAYTSCAAEGGYLAVINDQAEAREVVKILSPIDRSVWVHVGLRELEANGGWNSIHSDPFETIFNTWESAPSAHQCCYVAALSTYTTKLGAHTEPSKQFFLCEKDPSNVRFTVSDQQ